MKYDRERLVGEEASKTYLDNIDSGFFDKYMQGEIGLDKIRLLFLHFWNYQ